MVTDDAAGGVCRGATAAATAGVIVFDAKTPAPARRVRSGGTKTPIDAQAAAYSPKRAIITINFKRPGALHCDYQTADCPSCCDRANARPSTDLPRKGRLRS